MRDRRFTPAWLIAGVPVAVLPDTLRGAGFGSADRGLAVSLVVGLASGALWYWLQPRPLARRLTLVVVVWLGFVGTLAVTSLLGITTGVSGPVVDGDPSTIALGGTLCALVLAERWHHARDDFRDETRRLRERDRCRQSEADRP